MSKGECKSNKIICVVISVVCILTVAFFLLRAGKKYVTQTQSENMKVEYKDGDRITLSADVSRDELFDKLSEKGFEIPPLFLLLPDRLEFFCDAEINVSEKGSKPLISIIALRFNELELPQKLLSEIGEINLDFKRSLVYN